MSLIIWVLLKDHVFELLGAHQGQPTGFHQMLREIDHSTF